MKTNIRLYSVLNWTVDVSVCRRFGLSAFRFVDGLVANVSVCRRFDQLPTKGSTHQILVTKWTSFCRHVQVDFFNDIFLIISLSRNFAS